MQFAAHASSSRFLVECGTFEPKGWGASVVPLYCSGLTQQACSVNHLSGAGGAQRVRGVASGAPAQRAQISLSFCWAMRYTRAARQRLVRYMGYSKLLQAQRCVSTAAGSCSHRWAQGLIKHALGSGEADQRSGAATSQLQDGCTEPGIAASFVQSGPSMFAQSVSR